MSGEALMMEGVALLENGRLAGALRCFDESIRLREHSPWERSPHAAWLLAGAWLNRSDVLRRWDPPDYPGAWHSLEMALARALRSAPRGELRHATRLALCYLNRATLLHETRCPSDALADFAAAEQVLAESPDPASPSCKAHRVMCGVNKALALLDLGSPAGALASLAACRDEAEALGAPDAVFRWHLAGCRATGAMLENGGGEPPSRDALEIAIRALRLAAGLDRHHGRIPELLAYGAVLCRTCGPEWFGGFVSECERIPGVLDSLRRRLDLAGTVLLAIRDLELRVLHGWHDSEPCSDPVGLLRKLQDTRTRLLAPR